MIKEVTMFTVVCDNCGMSADEGTEYSAWTDKVGAVEAAIGNDWENLIDKDYCPLCFTYNDSDEIVIDTSRTKGATP